jgi:ferredoxin
MLCGPLPMIEEMRSVLGAIGVPSPQVHFEKFETAVSLATAAAGRAIDPAEVRRTVDVNDGQTILDAARPRGVSLSSMCRAGMCGTCGADRERRRRLRRDRRIGSGRGFVLACVARPRTDCVVEA